MKNTCAKIHLIGWASGPQALLPWTPPWTQQPSLWGPRGSAAPKLSSIYSISPGKKSGRRIHRVLRYGGAATSCSSSGGQIWSPLCAPERGNRRHHHNQPSSIDNSMMLFIVLSNLITGLLDGDELDEIYHVIELVLTGIDP